MMLVVVVVVMAIVWSVAKKRIDTHRFYKLSHGRGDYAFYCERFYRLSAAVLSAFFYLS